MATETLEIVIKADNQASGALGGIKNALGDIFKTATGFVVGQVMDRALSGIADFGQSIVSETLEAEQVQAQLQAVIKSTGAAAGVSAEMANDLAAALSQTSTFADDAVLSGENMLLTFTNIGKDVFPGATQTMLDMSQALGQDMKSSAMQLGKALNDPVAGISALTRVGVTFTDQQKKQIEAMVAAGDTAGAQKVILAELAKEFGGSASAAASTAGGQWTVFQNQMMNVAEAIGGALMPAVQQIATVVMPYIIEWANQLTTFVQSDEFKVWIADIANFLSVQLPAAIQTGAAFWESTLQPALAVVGAFLVTQLIPAIATMVQWLQVNIPIAVSAAAEFWDTKLWPAIDRVRKFFAEDIPAAVATLRKAWDSDFGGLKSTFEAVSKVVQDVFALFQKAKDGDWFGFGEGLRKLLSDVWGTIGTMATAAWENIKTALTTLWTNISAWWGGIDWGQLGKDIVIGIIKGMIAMSQWLGDAIIGVVKAAVGVAAGFLGIEAPSFGGLTAGANGGGGTTNNTNYTLNVNTSANYEPIMQDFAMMQSLAGGQ